MFDYKTKIKPLQDAGKTDIEIAAILTADPSRNPPHPMTAGEIVTALSVAGQDGVAILDRVLVAIAAGVANSPSKQIIVGGLSSGGAVDLANPLIRAFVAAVATAEDATAVLGLAPLADAITETEVVEARNASNAMDARAAVMQAYQDIFTDTIAPALSSEVLTTATLSQALFAAAAEMENTI